MALCTSRIEFSQRRRYCRFGQTVPLMMWLRNRNCVRSTRNRSVDGSLTTAGPLECLWWKRLSCPQSYETRRDCFSSSLPPPVGQSSLMLRFVPAFRSPINFDMHAPPPKIQFAYLRCSRQFDERHAAAPTRPHHVQSPVSNWEQYHH
jgi:hypothetical protein